MFLSVPAVCSGSGSAAAGAARRELRFARPAPTPPACPRLPRPPWPGTTTTSSSCSSSATAVRAEAAGGGVGPAGRGPRGPRGGQTGGEVPGRAGRAGGAARRSRAPGVRRGARGRAPERLGRRAAERRSRASRGRGWGARSTRRACRCLTCDLGQVARSLELERPGFECRDRQPPQPVTLARCSACLSLGALLRDAGTGLAGGWSSGEEAGSAAPPRAGVLCGCDRQRPRKPGSSPAKRACAPHLPRVP